MNLQLTVPTPATNLDDAEINTPPPIHAQHINPLSFANGATKNRGRRGAAAYRECMRNHAASLGGHAVDGCGEYMPPPSSSAADPASLKCAACGCHRNFHRREPDSPGAAITPPFLDFRHPVVKRSSPSASPPPPSFPHAPPHMLLALSTAVAAEEHHGEAATPTVENPVGRKRFRTKFSQEQKEKMQSFSEKMGWKMQRSDEAAAEEFCREIGVSRGVLKVWMHNNKNTFCRKDAAFNGGASDSSGGKNE